MKTFVAAILFLASFHALSQVATYSSDPQIQSSNQVLTNLNVFPVTMSTAA